MMTKSLRSVEGLVTKTVKIDYQLTYGGYPGGKPLLVDLHGAGERGTNLQLIDNFCISNLMPKKYQKQFVVMTALCPPDRAWNIDSIYYGIRQVCLDCEIDENRIYGIAFSMGARGLWDTSCEYPNLFTAIAPFAGYTCYLNAPKIAHLPVWCFHGDNDYVVPVEESEKMIGALKKCGGNPRFSKFDGGHGGWELLYRQNELYDWFLTHKKG